MKILEESVNLFSLRDYDCREVEGHEGGRNKIFVCSKDGEKRFVLRISATGDRTENDYLLQGYKSQTSISDELLNQLPLFIDMVLIENIVDEFECSAQEGEELDYEDIEDAAECLINNIPYAGTAKGDYNGDG